jgi:hypothetical protein
MIGLPSIAKRDAIALADVNAMRGAARRTTVLRVGLVLAIAGVFAWLLVTATAAGAGRAAVFSSSTRTGVVALDMSASISGPTYARVATTLNGIVNANQSVGLVMFSDTAYELLPPNSPPSAMLQFVPFFVPARYYGSTPVFAQTPWDTFMGGTRIASGLEAARLALLRAHVLHGEVLLVSDLDDSSADAALLEQEALKLRNDHIAVRIVPLFAAPPDKTLFAALFGDSSFVNPSVFTHTATRHAAPVVSRRSTELLLAGLVLLLLVAANERWNARLTIAGAV